MLSWGTFVETSSYININVLNEDRQRLFPLDAALYTVEKITKTYNPPYTLLLSGGVDSQSMLYAWHKSGVKFNTFSAVFNHNLNEYDLSYLKGFAHYQGIDVRNYVDFDLFNFLDYEYPDYVEKYKCGSPHICTIMKLASLVGEGTVVSSGNFIEPGGFRFTRNLCGLLRYAQDTSLPFSFIPLFLMETPELAYSFIDLFPEYEDQLGKIDQYTIKVDMFTGGGFPVLRQHHKMTGYEEVKQYYDTHFSDRVTPADKLVTGSLVSHRVFDLLYRNKYENKYNKKLLMINR